MSSRPNGAEICGSSESQDYFNCCCSNLGRRVRVVGERDFILLPGIVSCLRPTEVLAASSSLIPFICWMRFWRRRRRRKILVVTKEFRPFPFFLLRLFTTSLKSQGNLSSLLLFLKSVSCLWFTESFFCRKQLSPPEVCFWYGQSFFFLKQTKAEQSGCIESVFHASRFSALSKAANSPLRHK